MIAAGARFFVHLVGDTGGRVTVEPLVVGHRSDGSST